MRQGSGGKIGYGFSHLEPEVRDAWSLKRLRKAIDWAERGDPTGLYEPKPGHVAVYPDYCAKTDGRKVVVKLAGAKIKLSKRPSKTK